MSCSVGGDSQLHLWDVQRPAIALHSLHGHREAVTAFAFLPWHGGTGAADRLLSVGKDHKLIRHALSRQPLPYADVSPVAISWGARGDLATVSNESIVALRQHHAGSSRSQGESAPLLPNRRTTSHDGLASSCTAGAAQSCHAPALSATGSGRAAATPPAGAVSCASTCNVTCNAPAHASSAMGGFGRSGGQPAAACPAAAAATSSASAGHTRGGSFGSSFGAGLQPQSESLSMAGVSHFGAAAVSDAVQRAGFVAPAQGRLRSPPASPAMASTDGAEPATATPPGPPNPTAPVARGVAPSTSCQALVLPPAVGSGGSTCLTHSLSGGSLSSWAVGTGWVSAGPNSQPGAPPNTAHRLDQSQGLLGTATLPSSSSAASCLASPPLPRPDSVLTRSSFGSLVGLGSALSRAPRTAAPVTISAAGSASPPLSAQQRRDAGKRHVIPAASSTETVGSEEAHWTHSKQPRDSIPEAKHRLQVAAGTTGSETAGEASPPAVPPPPMLEAERVTNLARGYRFSGASVGSLCAHNAQVAASVGCGQLAHTWQALHFALGEIDELVSAEPSACRQPDGALGSTADLTQHLTQHAPGAQRELFEQPVPPSSEIDLDFAAASTALHLPTPRSRQPPLSRQLSAQPPTPPLSLQPSASSMLTAASVVAGAHFADTDAPPGDAAANSAACAATFSSPLATSAVPCGASASASAPANFELVEPLVLPLLEFHADRGDVTIGSASNRQPVQTALHTHVHPR